MFSPIGLYLLGDMSGQANHAIWLRGRPDHTYLMTNALKAHLGRSMFRSGSTPGSGRPCEVLPDHEGFASGRSRYVWASEAHAAGHRVAALRKGRAPLRHIAGEAEARRLQVDLPAVLVSDDVLWGRLGQPRHPVTQGTRAVLLPMMSPWRRGPKRVDREAAG